MRADDGGEVGGGDDLDRWDAVVDGEIPFETGGLAVGGDGGDWGEMGAVGEVPIERGGPGAGGGFGGGKNGKLAYSTRWPSQRALLR